jgi:hypothetical protein
MKKAAYVVTFLVALSIVAIANAQPNYSNSYKDGDCIVFEYPTYDGMPINSNTNTLDQWALELGYDNTYRLNTVSECFDPNEQIPNCRSWGLDETAGYNDGNWEVHNCAYNRWTWDHCYMKVIGAIVCSTVRTVQIDIKPGSYPNSINLKSKGVVPVAVLTTDDFDASAVDRVTVLFAGASPLRWAMEDVDGDGDVDLLFHFKTQELDLDGDSTEATLAGTTFGGQSIQGTDTVNIVPKGK